ncbi:hypothetical protein FA95DRAFT_115023 [Auriscalpium vulgare]|uniref:Uncharacterized protein n=1 Tax=Auriscalpium vulgare TaxID=40419 RepID=A0ACB8S7Z2_9AGAM|nr:hypothetical protein FA95DRAFT_115023 [Auriscalpium vulgare]
MSYSPESTPDLVYNRKGIAHDLNNLSPEAAALTCRPCRIVLGSQGDLRRHLRTSREHAPVRAYRCECGDSFSRGDALKRHRRTKCPIKDQVSLQPEVNRTAHRPVIAAAAAEVDMRAQPPTGAQVKVEASAKAEASTVAEVHAAPTKVEAQAKAKAQTDTEAQAKAKAQTDTEAQAKAKAQTETDAQTNATGKKAQPEEPLMPSMPPKVQRTCGKACSLLQRRYVRSMTRVPAYKRDRRPQIIAQQTKTLSPSVFLPWSDLAKQGCTRAENGATVAGEPPGCSKSSPAAPQSDSSPETSAARPFGGPSRYDPVRNIEGQRP